MKILDGRCVACAKGDLPEGAHKCVFRQKPVHALPGCSHRVKGEEEGEKEKEPEESLHDL